MATAIIVILLTGYLLGNLNGSVCISVLMEHDDVRGKGSGNAGLTNFYRNFGGKYTLLVAATDMAKAILACLVGKMILEPYDLGVEGLMLGALAVSLGHDFPALLGFKGGKGILSGFSIAIAADWRIALLGLLLFALCFGLTHYVSLGSVVAAAALGVGFVILYWEHPVAMACGVFLAALAIFMHRENISRLINGTESKIYLTKKGKAS